MQFRETIGTSISSKAHYYLSGLPHLNIRMELRQVQGVPKLMSHPLTVLIFPATAKFEYNFAGTGSQTALIIF